MQMYPRIGDPLLARPAVRLNFAPSSGFDPSTIASVMAWYHLLPAGLVDGQIIDTVQDQSGEGAEDLTQTSASLQPTYDLASGGWETSVTGGCLVGASLTDWKPLHGGAATVVARGEYDPTQTSWVINTLYGPHTGSGIWIYWNKSSSRWIVRIGDRQYSMVPSVAPSAMHTFVFTWDDLGQVDIYQDGVLVATASASPLFSTDDQASVIVTNASYFTGLGSSDQIVTDIIIIDEYVDASQALALHDGLTAYRA